MEFYVVYNSETGDVATKGQGPDGAAMLQQLEPGFAVMIVPRQAVQTTDPNGIDIRAIRTSYAASVDQDADKIRSIFITNTPGQVGTYLEKEAEARRVIAGDLSDLVYLPLEAAAVGKDVPSLAAEVIAVASEWRPINAKIEAARIGAKDALVKAENLAAIAAAVKIDWREVTAPLQPQE